MSRANKSKRKKFSEQSRVFGLKNKITAKEKQLLEKEKERREVYTQIKSIQKDTNMSKREKDKRLPKLYADYYKLDQQVKDICFTPAGLFNDSEFDHLLRNGKLDVSLLKKCN